MSKQFQAEIAGGGICALTTAAALAQRGWKVRVHERNSEIREAGAGIYIWGNGLRVLEAVGAREEALRNANRGMASELRDCDNNVIPRVPVQGEGAVEVFALPRQQLLQALLHAALTAGVEVVTGSEAVGATPDGRLLLRDGSSLAADVVVGADGVHSRVRDSLGLASQFELLSEGAIRVMVPRLPQDGDGRFVEHWNGTRRILVTPCSPDQVYIALTCLHNDTAAARVPVDKALWTASFPHLASLIDRIGASARWDRFSMVKLKRWSQDHVAVTGDAAHAMPPNLGQGGGTAMQNGLSLAHELGAVASREDIPQALARWEERERELTEHTQLWSMLYGVLTSWPDELRTAAMGFASSHPWLSAQRLRTARSHPTGASPLATEGAA